MAKMTDNGLRKALREEMLKTAIALFEEAGYTVVRTKGNKLGIGCVDADGNDRWAELTMAIPTGARDDDEGYDAEILAQDYADHMAELEEKKKEKEAERAKKQAERQAKIEEKKRLKALEEAAKLQKAEAEAEEENIPEGE